ncbi:exported hypothetical protein [Agrobacterium tumefaciens str. CFBP 5621]|nr:exported hypothetical protein [Agrobacterium tumefaciens str. CFBP 5621]
MRRWMKPLCSSLRCNTDFFSGNAVAFGPATFLCRPHLSVHHQGDANDNFSLTTRF